MVYLSAVLKFPTRDDVVKLVAIDQDSELYNKVRFTITSTIFPSRGRNLPIDGAFTINPETGQIRVGMPAYIAFTDGYFIVDVKVEDQLDSSKSSATRVRVSKYVTVDFFLFRTIFVIKSYVFIEKRVDIALLPYSIQISILVL